MATSEKLAAVSGVSIVSVTCEHKCMGWHICVAGLSAATLQPYGHAEKGVQLFFLPSMSCSIRGLAFVSAEYASTTGLECVAA